MQHLHGHECRHADPLLRRVVVRLCGRAVLGEAAHSDVHGGDVDGSAAGAVQHAEDDRMHVVGASGRRRAVHVLQQAVCGHPAERTGAQGAHRHREGDAVLAVQDAAEQAAAGELLPEGPSMALDFR